MKFSNLKITLSVAALVAVMAGSSNAAIFVAPTSPDGPGYDLQSQLIAHGIGSDVNLDQVSYELFMAVPLKTPTLDVLFQVAGYAPQHIIGYYETPGVATVPTDVVGGTSSGYPMSAPYSPVGIFGLTLTVPQDSVTYYTEHLLNIDSQFEHAVVLKERDSLGKLIVDSYIVAWEDYSYGGDRDHNDIAVRVSGVQATPEPGTIAMLITAIPAVGMLLRRRRK